MTDVTTSGVLSPASYQDFIASKLSLHVPVGFAPSDLSRYGLFDFQSAIVDWAVKRGRAAIFADTGLGKTACQLAFADQVATFTGKPVLILAPLCVAQQTVREAQRIGIADCRYARTKALVIGSRIVVVNYEMLEHFAGVDWGGVVLDESSILKSFEGKIRNAIISQFADTDYRLSCTATPSPNDFMELGNQAEFLGVMSRTEMLAQFFIHDGGDTSQWRLKGHGKTVFWQWMSTWAVCIRSPADLGFDGSRYILHPLNTYQHTVDAQFVPSDQLFSTVALTLNDRRAAKRVSIEDRVKAAADLVNGNTEKWIVWCHLNDESAALTKAIPDAIEVTGSMPSAEKENRIMAFINGESRVIVSKSSIMGFGLNLQLCAHMAFVGLDDSYEAYYQAVRRCYRFGQTRPVEVHIISSEGEGAILKNIERKAAQAQEMSAAMVGHMREFSQREIHGAHRETNDYERDIAGDEDWTLHLGDCVDVVSEMESNSIGYTIFSPPFASLYTYSNSHRDMGNCRGHTDFYQHFRFLVDDLLRVTKDGRLLSFHCTNIPMMKGRDGQIGIHDFRGELIKLFVDAGWIFHSEVVIWKDPVTAMQRTKALGLLYKQLRKDSCMSRMGIPDYLVTMRKPGVNPEPVTKTHDGFPVSLWQQYASPVWMDVNPTRTLQYRAARDNDDEKHICLAAGSLVLTREYGYIEIEDIEPGDHVLTHLGRWMPVLAKRCNGIAETIQICAQGVADLTVTPDHQLWTRRVSGAMANESARNNAPEWVESQDTLGSYLNLKLPPEEPNELTNDEWWIIGRWLGDGHRGTRRTSGARGAGFGEFIISCNHDEANELLKRLGDHAGYSAVRTATQITLKGLRKEVRETLNRCGQGAGNKRLPGEAVSLSQDKSQSLLEGYLSADGHYVEKHDRHCASSISRALLLGMAMVAQRAYGVVASVYAGRPARQGEIEGRPVKMRQDWIFAFRMSEGYKKSGWIDDEGAWKKVRKIECADDREVWDLQVAEDASFTAEGCIVHNCPLQLDVIERAVELWSNPGDVVLSPFAGIGSEGYVALQMGRRFVGSELKRSYFDVACRNLAAAKSMQGGLFAGHEEQINAAA
jgi:DNA modification methylase